MSTYSETILTSQSYNDHSSAPTVQSVTSDQYKGDGFYGRSDGLHTVQYSVSDFTGVINMQATLAVDPTEADWFTVPNTDLSSTNNSTGSSLYNFTGNYVWVRARVSNWTNGSITSIKLNH